MREKTALGIVYPALCAGIGISAGVSVAAGQMMLASVDPGTVRAIFIGSIVAVLFMMAIGWAIVRSITLSEDAKKHRLRRFGVPAGIAAVLGLIVWFVAASPLTTMATPAVTASIPSPAPTPPIAQQQPPSDLLLSMFMTDYSHITGASTNAIAAIIWENGKQIGTIYFRITYDKGSHSKFMLIYVPASPNDIVKLMSSTASQINRLFELEEASNPIRGFQAQAQGESDPEKFVDYPFSGRIYIYHESPLGAEDQGSVAKQFSDNKMFLQMIGRDAVLGVWANIQLGIVKPLPHFELGDIVCLKGPLGAPLPVPALQCTPGRTSPQTSP